MVTSQQPQINPVTRYTINETCLILGIHRNTLRSYVKAGLIKPTTGITRQRFKGTEILRFWNLFV